MSHGYDAFNVQDPLGYMCAICGCWFVADPTEMGLAFWRCSICDGPVGPVSQSKSLRRSAPRQEGRA